MYTAGVHCLSVIWITFINWKHKTQRHCFWLCLLWHTQCDSVNRAVWALLSGTLFSSIQQRGKRYSCLCLRSPALNAARLKITPLLLVTQCQERNTFSTGKKHTSHYLVLLRKFSVSRVWTALTLQGEGELSIHCASQYFNLWFFILNHLEIT